MNAKKALSSLAAATILAFGLVGCSSDSNGQDAAGSSTEGTQSEEVAEPTEVESTEYEPFVAQGAGFQITFPAPVEEILEESGDYVRQWAVEESDGSGYMVGILAGNPEVTAAPTEEWAREAMAQAISSFETEDGIVIVNHDYDLTFEGLPAAFAELRADVDGESEPFFVLYFFNLETSDVYNIMTMGVDHAAFDTFANSFEFTK